MWFGLDRNVCLHIMPQGTQNAGAQDDEDESKGSKRDDVLTAQTYVPSLCVILWDFTGWII